MPTPLPIGTRLVTRHGYVTLKLPDHPRADVRGRVFEHVVIVSRVLGRPLPASSPVHHVDRDGTNNTNGNLVVCQDEAYHRLLHIRQNALDACGNPNWRKCPYCHLYADPSDMIVHSVSGRNEPHLCHQECRKQYGRARRAGGKVAA